MAQISLVPGQFASANSTAAVATLAVAFPAQTKVGSLLCAHGGATAAITSITDDGLNTWTNDIAVNDPNVATDEAWHTYNAKVCQTVTIHFAVTGAFAFVAVSEYRGANRAYDPKILVSDQSDGGTAANSTCPDVTPDRPGCLTFVINRDTGAGAATWNSPFTLLSQSGQADCDGYYVQGQAAAIHADANNTGDTHWHVGMVTFIPEPDATLAMPKTMRGPRVRFKMPLARFTPDALPVVTFDGALMAAITPPWPSPVAETPSVVASGMAPPNDLIP